MPVIRERNNFAIGPIGVARVSAGVSGSNAAGTVANAVSAGANQMADMFFRQGAQAAEKTGLEQGAAIAQEKVLAIDPKTGEPVAYDAPQGFGTIAQEAYQRVVLSRFQTGIEQEIKIKAQELAVKHDGSVGRYTAAMSDYIGAMTENADGQFKTYISDVGTSYLNATRSAMAIDQIRRERAAAGDSLNSSIGEGINLIEWLYSQNGQEEAAIAGPTMTTATELSVQKAIQDGVDSNLISPKNAKIALTEFELGRIRGLVRYAAKSGASSSELTMLNSAIGTANPAMVPSGFEYIADSLSALGANYGAFADLEKFSSGIFDDAISAQKDIEAQEIAAAKTNNALIAFQTSNEAAALASSARDSALKYNSGSIVTLATDMFFQSSLKIEGMIKADNADGAKAAIEARDSEFNGYAEGIGLKALAGLNPSQTLQVEAAIDQGNPALAPPSAVEGVKAILALAKIQPKVIKDFLSQVSSVREGSAKVVAQLQDAAAFSLVTAFAPDALQGIQTSNAKNTEEKLAAFSSFLNGVPNLKPEDKARFEKRAYLSSGISYLSGFFASSPTPEEISQAEAYIATGTSTDALKPASRALLDKVREYGTKSENEAELRTQFSTLSGRAADMRIADETDLANRKMLAGIANGSVIPSDEKAQALWDKELSGQYGLILSDAFLDPTLPVSTGVIMTDIIRAGVMPTSLKDVLVSASKGQLNSAQTMIVISHWNNIRFKTDDSGAEILSPMVDGTLKPEQIASLDMLSAFGSDPQKITELLNAKTEFDTNPVFKNNLEKTLGTDDKPMSLDDFVLNLYGIEDAPRSAFPEMKAAAMVYFSTRSITGVDVSTIKAKLEAQIAKSYPDGGGIVYGTNNSSRTSAALSMTASGYEKEFKDYLLSVVSNIGTFEIDGELKSFSAGSLGFKAAESGYRRYQNPIFLMPVGPAVGPDTKYRMMIFRSLDEGGSIPVMIGSNRTPLIISPNDPAFVAIKDAKVRQQKSAEERRNPYGFFNFGSGE